jgi:hypothetical protein
MTFPGKRSLPESFLPLARPLSFALLALAFFIAHQLSQKVWGWRWAWADNYLDNLLCMPILLGGLLLERYWLLGQQRLSLPTVLAAAAFVSLVSEYFFPRFSAAFTADWWDVAAYFAGALAFYLCQQPHSIAT